MKTAEARRELKKLGVEFKEGSKHTKLYFKGKQTTMPRHGEIPEQFFKEIKKQLGIK